MEPIILFGPHLKPMNEAAIQLAYNYFIYPSDTIGVVNVPENSSRAKRINYHKVSKILASIGFAFLIFYFTPVVFNSIIQGNESIVMDSESERIMQALNSTDTYQPAQDSSLPLGSYLKVPKIGIETSIYENSYENHEEALKKGAWRVPDYGTPSQRGVPVILAAHRFGYIAWSNVFRRQHSFYNLPKLENGDTVEIIWDQRKYTYAIYGESEGTEITDYSADLILYTCVDLSSNVRIFKYAKLLRI